MHFVDNINFVLSDRGRILYLCGQIADFLDAVVAGCVQFYDVKVVLAAERTANFAFSAGEPSTGCRQFIARAKIFAEEVLPVPRVPVNK